MTPTTFFWFAIAGAVAAWLLTSVVRRYALASSLIDVPNARSSHRVPTPRGGGVAIVVSFLVLVIVSWAIVGFDDRLLAAIEGAGWGVAALGFIDDRSHLAARWRFLGHTAAAAWVLWCMGGIPAVPLFGTAYDLGWPGLILAGIYIVWSINLFNFMDGIDAIASIEAITVMLGGSLVWWVSGGEPGWMSPILLAACVCGFLAWNFPPARIFMGDAGSGFLGLMVALFSLWCSQATPHLFWSWFILYGVFIVDATVTLLRRVHRKQTFYEAHRSHAYQYASRRHGSHRDVSLTIGVVNVLWLLPLALLVAVRQLDGAVGVLIAYAPLVVLAYRYKAGDAAAQEAFK